MKEYTVAEFRANTREILNSVDQGREVVLIRYDARYSIKPILKGTFKVDPEFADLKGAKIVGVKLKPGVEKAPGDVVTADEILDDDSTILENGKIVKKMPPKKSIKQAQKRINKANEKIAEKGLEQLKKLKSAVEPVDSCPHGFAKGFCKKSECNRKYQQ